MPVWPSISVVGYPGYCSNGGENIGAFRGLKVWIKILEYLKLVNLNEKNIRDSTVEVFKISGGSHYTNEGLNVIWPMKYSKFGSQEKAQNWKFYSSILLEQFLEVLTFTNEGLKGNPADGVFYI